MHAEKYSLLVVEDDEYGRDILSRQLEKQGYSVAVAENGRQALEMLKIERYDLMLLDIQMPEMDGFHVLENIKTDRDTKHIPVIMLTGITDQDSVLKAINLGAEDYLVKPFSIQIVRARVWRSLKARAGNSNYPTNGEETEENQSARILVVDDNEINRDILKRRLKRFGCSIDEAENGMDALDMLHQNEYDLVLLDIMMPVMNGFDTLEKIKSDPQSASIPVIMITADDRSDSAEKCFALGAEDYITKPFDSTIIRSRVSSCIKAVKQEKIEAQRRKELEELSVIGAALQQNK
jgi:CheY-like chemotaxis protein